MYKLGYYSSLALVNKDKANKAFTDGAYAGKNYINKDYTGGGYIDTSST